MNEDKPRESQAIDYMLSLKSKMELLLKTADMADGDPLKAVEGGQSPARIEQVNKEMEETIERIKRGDKVTVIARELGLTPSAIFGRLNSRGLSVKLIRSENKS